MSEKRTKFHYTFSKTFSIASIYEDDRIICKDMLIEEETLDKIIDLLNEFYYKIEQLKIEKGYLVDVIDENLLKGYHEQSLKHKEAKEKMEHEDERMEASIILDVVFYWDGYVKALEELKEGMTDE